ncbi:MAG: PAS domain-containing sensor histidine kinase [Ginsengibacter sp.]
MPTYTENQILKENQQFEALFQNASLGILVIDKTGDIVLVNNFLVAQFGFDNSNELIGNKVEVLIPVRFHKHHVKDRNGYNANPERRPMGIGRDLFGVKKNGDEFPVEISLSSFNNDEGFFVIAFVSDITKRKEIEQAVFHQQEELASINKTIEKLNHELENKVIVRTQQLQSTLQELEKSKDELIKALSKEKELSDLKSRFVSMASHEFRTPLSTILSSVSLLAKYSVSEEQEKRDKHIHRIKSAVNNLTDILNEFLSIDRIEDGKIIAKNSLFDIKELITNLCNEINGILKPGQQLIYKHTGNTDIYLDSSLLKNILINLISNAIKFSGENSPINILSNVVESIFKLKVKDAGIGMSKEDQKHLFERFFRGTNVSNIQGTGLGLHIVGKYIELMNGNITVKSELEKGTEIIITFHV